MDRDEAQARLLRRRLSLLRFATDTQDETALLTEGVDPASPVGQALEEIGKHCQQLIQMLESPARMSPPEASRDE